MADSTAPSSSTGPVDTSARYIQQDILASLELIEAHTRAMTSLIPEQSVELGKQISQYKVGPSTPGTTTPAGIGASAGASVGSDPMGGPFSWLHYPGTRPTPVDYFQMLSAGASRLSQRSVASNLNQALQDHLATGAVPPGTTLDNQGNLLDASGQLLDLNTLPPNVAKNLSSITQQGGAFGSLANTFSGLASGYVTGRKIQGLLQDVTAPFTGAMNLGYQTGASGGSPGFLGLRAPWDPGVLAGASQFINRIGFALGNDVTPGQAGTIYSSLYQNGWLAGPQTNAMRLTGAQLIQDNPVLGSTPQVYSMMDQSTRMGTASLSQFVDLMKQVPDAMAASHTSMTQTLTDWEQVGQAIKQQGGTFYQGMMLGNAWQHITGLPAASMTPFLNNPIVQGQTFLHTGLMPWEQGLATPGSRINSIMSSIGMMRNIINTRGPITQSLGGGFSSQVSGNQQAFALMSHFFGVDSSTLQALYSHRQGITTGSNLWDWLGAWQHEKNPTAALGSNGASNNWGAIRQGLHQAMYLGNDGKAHYMFSPKDIQKVADVQRSVVDAHYASAGHWAQGAGAGRPIRGPGPIVNQWHPGEHWVPAHPISAAYLHAMESGKAPLSKALAQQVINQRAKMVNQMMGTHSGQNSPAGTTITLSLSKAAQKMFNMSDPAAQFKAGRNAGTMNINMNPNATGPTTSPMPDVNTADNYSQYSSGQPFYPPGYASGAPGQ